MCLNILLHNIILMWPYTGHRLMKPFFLCFVTIAYILHLLYPSTCIYRDRQYHLLCSHLHAQFSLYHFHAYTHHLVFTIQTFKRVTNRLYSFCGNYYSVYLYFLSFSSSFFFVLLVVYGAGKIVNERMRNRVELSWWIIGTQKINKNKYVPCDIFSHIAALLVVVPEANKEGIFFR